jgi:hypothetical protein
MLLAVARGVTAVHPRGARFRVGRHLTNRKTNDNSLCLSNSVAEYPRCHASLSNRSQPRRPPSIRDQEAVAWPGDFVGNGTEGAR